jgi:hypothetical protein
MTQQNSFAMLTVLTRRTAGERGDIMLPTGQIFGRIIQRGPDKKLSGQTKLRPNFWLILFREGP